MALNFACQANGFTTLLKVDLQCVINSGEIASGGEIHVHHGTDDLNDFADVAHKKNRNLKVEN